MKKLYIQPTIEVETIESSIILALSLNLEDKDFTDKTETDVDNNVKPSDGTNFGDAKRGYGITWDYNSKYDWDL